jgi:hypothetical protein
VKVLQLLADLFGADRYIAHAYCLTNDPIIMSVYVGGNFAIWLSYMVIGLCILKNRAIMFSLNWGALFLYGMFIFLCGLTHLSSIITLFTAVYRLDVALLALTGAISLITSFYTVMALILHDSPPGTSVSEM